MARRASRLQRELRQNRPFQTDAQEAVLALVRTADRVRREAARVVEPHDLTLQQYNVLRILRGAGDAGVPTLEVGERMIEQTPGVTRLMDRLEAKGYIRRERCRPDRRQHLCRLTPEAARLLERLDAPMLAAHDASLHGLDAAGRRQLVKLLAAIRTPPPAGQP
jgi:DNA-binding MarR family transcriptional regulator